MKFFALFCLLSSMGHAQERIANLCLSFIKEESYAAECIVVANRYAQFSEQEKMKLINGCKKFKKPDAQLSCVEQAFSYMADKERYFKSLAFSKEAVQETCRFIYTDLGDPASTSSATYTDWCINRANKTGVTPAEIYLCRKTYPAIVEADGRVDDQYTETLWCIEKVGRDANEGERGAPTSTERCRLTQRLMGRCQ